MWGMSSFFFRFYPKSRREDEQISFETPFYKGGVQHARYQTVFIARVGAGYTRFPPLLHHPQSAPCPAPPPPVPSPMREKR